MHLHFLEKQSNDPFDPANLRIQADYEEELGDQAAANALRSLAEIDIPSLVALSAMFANMQSIHYLDYIEFDISRELISGSSNDIDFGGYCTRGDASNPEFANNKGFGSGDAVDGYGLSRDHPSLP